MPTPKRPDLAPFGELIFSKDENYTTLSRQQRAGRAIKLAPGVYVVGAVLSPDQLADHHLWDIVAHFWPGAVVCDRSALAGGPSDGWLFLCHPDPPRTRDLTLPGVSITCRVGPGPLPGDMAWPAGLFLSSTARGLVENVSARGRRPTGRPPRAAGAAAVGDGVDELARSGESGRVRQTLDQLEQSAAAFDPDAVEQVRRLLVAVLGTLPDAPIASALLAARVAGEPYDAHRAELFERFRASLDATAPSVRPATDNPPRWRWLPFFEAYFSNYIEGTVFSVEEARSIAIDGVIPPARPADAHDVAATYRLVDDTSLMRQVPTDADSFVDIVRERHRVLMAGRPEKGPGVFKTRQNFAGGFAFVTPPQLVGTLRVGWDVMADIGDPFHRAVMMMFVVTECHPFDDGNGRLARIMANAELVTRAQVRLVVPNSYRNNYLAALTLASNAGDGRALASVLDFTRRWVSLVDWSNWDTALRDLEASNAFKDSAAAEQSGERLRLPPAAGGGFTSP